MIKKSQILKLRKKFDGWDPWEIAEYHGITVKEFPLTEECLGFILCVQGQWYIAINEDLDYAMAEITMLHELGHFFNHQHMTVFYMSTTLSNKGKMEREADAFAMLWKYPSDEEFLQLGETVSQVASITGISADLIELRKDLIE